jgi:hypothetical protein
VSGEKLQKRLGEVKKTRCRDVDMVEIKCETCDDITTHLIIWKGDVQY